jgi:hypothetical protein
MNPLLEPGVTPLIRQPILQLAEQVTLLSASLRHRQFLVEMFLE